MADKKEGKEGGIQRRKKGYNSQSKKTCENSRIRTGRNGLFRVLPGTCQESLLDYEGREETGDLCN